MVTLDDIQQARTVLDGVAEHTRLIYSHTLSRLLGGHIYLKPELFQHTGSFKLRGAWFRIANLTAEQRKRGVITASAGNHAQGVAVAASGANIPAIVVMPATAPRAKAEATRGYGADVILHGQTYNDAFQHASALALEHGRTMIPAFDDPHVIAGQGTVGLEILEDLPAVDDIVVPVGGGGLISGIAVAARAVKPSVRVIGVQAAGAPSLVSALEAGRPVELTSVQTIADGIAVKRTGDLPFRIIKELVDRVVAVADEDILRAMVLLIERSKIVVEGAGAAPLAAALSGQLPVQGRKVVLVLSGGNVDIRRIGRILHRGLAYDRLVGRLASLASGDSPAAPGADAVQSALDELTVKDFAY